VWIRAESNNHAHQMLRGIEPPYLSVTSTSFVTYPYLALYR